MPDVMLEKYDDADFHYGTEVFSRKDLPAENGATHMGFYLTWVLMKGMESAELRANAGEAVEKVRAREMTGRELLMEYSDQKLLPVDLNDEANRFTRSYYRKYLTDYSALFGKAADRYEVENSWVNYDRIAAVIEKRWAAHQSKPWWKVW
ncbi:MAG: hypothetical protein JNK48_00250 [Bryobacterales bacterium]|nr:hypothetical protein [Bryobacterales bacterium]